jgi:glycosyltransferase involved in cell wall biosynthesis
MNKISVIVPIYNVEKYILYTIESIITQSFEDFELILVNDGSTDNSILLATNLLNSKGFPFIVLTQRNMGLSSARNAGIKKANSEWIICVDGDDILERDFLEDLYRNTVDSNSDIGIVNYHKTTLHSYVASSYVRLPSYSTNSDVIRKKFLLRKINIVVPAILIKKSILIQSNLYYDVNSKFSEDQIFLWRLLYQVSRIYYNPSKLYNYIQRDNSIMYTSKVEDIYSGYKGMINMINTLPCFVSKTTKKKIISRWVFGAVQTAIRTSSLKSSREIALTLKYRNSFFSLLTFCDIRVVGMSLLGLLNFRLLYYFSKHIGEFRG